MYNYKCKLENIFLLLTSLFMINHKRETYFKFESKKMWLKMLNFIHFIMTFTIC